MVVFSACIGVLHEYMNSTLHTERVVCLKIEEIKLADITQVALNIRLAYTLSIGFITRVASIHSTRNIALAGCGEIS